MDLIGERIKKKRELLGFLIYCLSTQIDITSSFIAQIIIAKKFLYHFTLKNNTITSYTTACILTIENEKLCKQKYDRVVNFL